MQPLTAPSLCTQHWQAKVAGADLDHLHSQCSCGMDAVRWITELGPSGTSPTFSAMLGPPGPQRPLLSHPEREFSAIFRLD